MEGLNSQTLRIGAHPSVAQAYLPRIFRYINQFYPQLYLEVSFQSSYEITRKIQAREIDVGLVVNPIKSQDLVIRRFAKEEIELCGVDPTQEEATLLRNPQMVFIEKLLRKTEFRRVIDIEDYNVAAAICEQDASFWAVLPSSVKERHPSLKTIKKLKEGVQIKLIT